MVNRTIVMQVCLLLEMALVFAEVPAEVVRKISRYREARSLPVLELSAELINTARERAGEMAENDTLSPGRTKIWERAEYYGFLPVSIGENMGKSYKRESDGTDIFDEWAKSRIHKENLEDRNDYTHMGMYRRAGRNGTFISVIFAKRAGDGRGEGNRQNPRKSRGDWGSRATQTIPWNQPYPTAGAGDPRDSLGPSRGAGQEGSPAVSPAARQGMRDEPAGEFGQDGGDSGGKKRGGKDDAPHDGDMNGVSENNKRDSDGNGGDGDLWESPGKRGKHKPSVVTITITRTATPSMPPTPPADGKEKPAHARDGSGDGRHSGPVPDKDTGKEREKAGHPNINSIKHTEIPDPQRTDVPSRPLAKRKQGSLEDIGNKGTDRGMGTGTGEDKQCGEKKRDRESSEREMDGGPGRSISGMSLESAHAIQGISSVDPKKKYILVDLEDVLKKKSSEIKVVIVREGENKNE
jgi:Cysteine-rich secretory protein family